MVQNEITVSSWFLLQSFKEPASFLKKAKNWQFRVCSLIGSLILLELWFQSENGSFDFLRTTGQGSITQPPLPAGCFFAIERVAHHW
jgi:hypothetical protein